MEAVIVWAVLGGLLLAAWVLRRARPAARAGRRRRSGDGLGLSDADRTELDSIARIVMAEHFETSSRLSLLLRRVVTRGVPVRRIEATTWPGHWYLAFADGSCVVIACADPTPVLAMRVALARGDTLTLSAAEASVGGLRLELVSGRQHHQVLAVAEG